MEPAQPTNRTRDDQPSGGPRQDGYPVRPGEDPMSDPAPEDRIPHAADEEPAPADDGTPDDRTESGDSGGRVRLRSERSPKDMALSLLVLLVPIALLLGFYRVFLGGDDPVPVDATPTIAEARAANAFPVSEPQGLDPKWRTVSAQFRRGDDGATLRVGYLSPDGEGVQLLQSNVPAERLLPVELTDKSRPQGPSELAGRSWQTYTARAGERALVLLESGRTVIVVGSAREEELRSLAGALR
ncbi:DUF4245 domain-containing protein [Micromonospora sp. NPDC049559]|uniref:DUF4245 domain-containing protein n=1 Tax=Micromonospora sp. NPDC049559 TaxID=3155923 RepID=UPI00343BA789